VILDASWAGRFNVRKQRPFAVTVLRAAAGWCASKLEYAGILVVEGMLRFVHRLDPRLYSRRARLKAVRQGDAVKPSGAFLIFVFYATGPLPGFTRTFIDAVARSPFNLILVANAPVEHSLAAELLSRCCLLIERANIGRDFGAYKDGIGVLMERFPDAQRLVIANDSVFYLRDGLDSLLRALNGSEDFIGVSEIYDHHYHVASFLQSFSRRVLTSVAFRRFWESYRPIGTRRWAILEGEGALTSALLKAGFRPHVLFRVSMLRSRLRAAGDLGALKPLLPPAICDAVAGTAEPDLPELIRRRFARAATQTPRAVADAVPDRVMATNQLHGAGFLFWRFMGLPLVKRDICYRRIHPLPQVASILTPVEAAARDEILVDLERRGDGGQIPIVLRPLYHHGII
jgi:hypothetical protein